MSGDEGRPSAAHNRRRSSVGYRAILKGRQAITIELAAQYFWDGCQYLKSAEAEMSMPTLFDLEGLGQAVNA